ncbi:uncharacterized protein PAC_04465 [Phialocephala subalpina]|uniref:N-acetyltransferase domain-containing protein n=1 Tax=Phialocephala subalpina TaxID=576137 RepID=A0A1L7WPA8_9HELO|nr:uncharacterized protein PAC_04465 [Phialocephala subalpina]
MLLTTLSTAQRLEEADILHLTRQVEACSKFFPDQKSQIISVGNGAAGITLPVFGRKLNHIVSYGMAGPVSTEDLAKAEEWYTEIGVDFTEIDLCPHADASAIQVLNSRGYSVNGFINQYARALTDEDLEEAEVPGMTILRLPADRAHEFPAMSLAGYKDNGRLPLLLETLGRIAVFREDTSLYFAMVDGKVAGSAGMALIKTSKGGVAHMYIDSTLPEYRGRGIQAALLKARMADARKAGYDLASVGARPQNGSSRNIERAGFSLAYAKTTFVKVHK